MSPWQYASQSNLLITQIQAATQGELPALRQSLTAWLDAWAIACPACDLAYYRAFCTP